MKVLGGLFLLAVATVAYAAESGVAALCDICPFC